MTNEKEGGSQAELIESFVAYCKAHPEQRFWQALTNWAELSFIGWAEDPSGKNFHDLWHARGKTK